MIRLSFSILEPWSRGDYDEALNRYWRVPIEPTEAMVQGSKLHEDFRSEVDKTGCLPQIFGGEKLANPQTELKLETMLEDWLQFVGIIDLKDGHKIYDYKTGKSGITSYSSSWQIPCYQVLLDNLGLDVSEGYFLYYNQYTGETAKSKKYLTQKSLNDAKEWIITFASEMYSALKESGEL